MGKLFIGLVFWLGTNIITWNFEYGHGFRNFYSQKQPENKEYYETNEVECHVVGIPRLNLGHSLMKLEINITASESCTKLISLVTRLLGNAVMQLEASYFQIS